MTGWLEGKLGKCSEGTPLLCDSCPCSGFPGFLDASKKYRYYEFRDWDCCLLSQSNPVDEGGFSGVDGHVIFQSVSGNSCIVVESTGNYATGYPVGGRYGIVSGYPAPFSSAVTGAVKSDSRRLGRFLDSACCNADGERIYAILYNDIYEEFE